MAGKVVRRACEERLGWLAGMAVASALMLTAVPSQSAEKGEIRDLALRLTGEALSVPGFAAYCNMYVEKNPRLLRAAQAWNERHWKYMQQTVKAVEWSGGMSKALREKLDRHAYSIIKREVESEPDKAGFCNDLVKVLDGGVMDWEKRPETAAALKAIMSLHVD